jgi:hypothetical protein
MCPPENINEASIPILTEVIDAHAPVGTVARNLPTPQAPTHAHPSIHTQALTPTQATANQRLEFSEQDWARLQNKVAEQVLRQLQGRIDFVLEQRVRDSLADVLQLAMIGLTGEIKRGLQHTLEEVIGRAVAQEIARLQNQKK